MKSPLVPRHAYDPRVQSSRKVNPLFALSRLGRPLKVALVADSIGTESAGVPGGQQSQGSWVSRGSAYTDGKLVVFNYSISGNNSVNVVTNRRYLHFANNPDVVILHNGQNSLSDANQATHIAAMLTCILDALAAGCVVVLPTLTATQSSKATYLANANAYNAQLLAWATQYEKVILGPDFFNLWTSGQVATYTFDNIHPGYNGAEFMGRTFANWIAPLIINTPTIHDLIALAGTSVLSKNDYNYNPWNGYYYGAGGTITATSAFTGGTYSTRRQLLAKVGGGGAYPYYANSGALSASKWYLPIQSFKGETITTNATLKCGPFLPGGPGVIDPMEGHFDSLGSWATVLSAIKTTALITSIENRSRWEHCINGTAFSANLEVTKCGVVSVESLETLLGISFGLP